MNARTRLRVALKTNAISLQILAYFFDNFFIFRGWLLIVYLSTDNSNTSLYLLLLNFLILALSTRYSGAVRSLTANRLVIAALPQPPLVHPMAGLVVKI